MCNEGKGSDYREVHNHHSTLDHYSPEAPKPDEKEHLPKGSMVFTEDTNIRKRRTAIVVPMEGSKGTYKVAWTELGPTDTFEHAEGVKQAAKRLEKAEANIAAGADPGKWVGTLEVEGSLEKGELADIIEDILYTGGVLRTVNTIDASDILRLVKLGRDASKALKALGEELIIVGEGVPELPDKYLNLMEAVADGLEQLKEWKHFNPTPKVS